MGFKHEALREAVRLDLADTDSVDRRRPLWSKLSPASRSEFNRLVAWLARAKPAAYSVFVDEDDLIVSLADAAEQLGDLEWDIDELLDRAVSAATGDWVISVPLIGVASPRGVRGLDDRLVLTPAGTWPHSGVDSRAVRREVSRLVGAPADIGARYEHDVDDKLIDTRRTATLISTLRGSRGWSSRVAFEQGRFLLAGWTMFAPPEADLHTPMWPQITEWLPQPQLQVQGEAYRLAVAGGAAKHRGMTVVHGPDENALWPWPDDETVSMVVRAVRASERSRAATALVCAAWDLYCAAHNPSDVPWIERLVHVMHAREAMCEDPSGNERTLNSRYQRACDDLRVAEALKSRGWGAAEVQAANGELRQLRNLATHSSDVARLRLGHPPLRARTKLETSRVVEIYVREAVSPTYHVVRELCIRLWRRMDGCGYDDAHYDSIFDD